MKQWIEFGSDGHPYHVRKKTKTPSARELLSDIFARLKKSSFPFSRAYQRDHHIVPASLSTPLYLPAPPIPNATWTPTLPIPPHHQTPSGPDARAMAYTQPFDHTRGTGDPNSDNPRGIMKPQPQSFPVPHSSMYPAPPQHAIPPQQHPGFGSFPIQNQMPNQMQHVPTQPPRAFSSQALPRGARIISPPRYPTADELRYNCSTCGRFRSARYHYKHPLPPGQLPGKTVCCKCQEEATESEESSVSSDSRYVRRRPRRRFRSRSRAASRDPIPRRARSRSGRSLSREDWSEDEYEDDIRDARRSFSQSSSLDIEPLRSRTRRSRPPTSPSIEVIRYVERPPRPRLTRRVVYVENERPRRDEEYFWDEAGGDFEYRPSHRYLNPLLLIYLLTKAESEDSRDRQRQHHESCDIEYLIHRSGFHSPLSTMNTLTIEVRAMTIMSRPPDHLHEQRRRLELYQHLTVVHRGSTMYRTATRGTMMASDDRHTGDLDL